MRGVRVICAVTNDLNQDQRMHRICSTLSKKKFLVTLIGREKPTSRAIPRFRFKTDRLVCRKNKGILFYIEYNYRLYKYLQKANYDIVNANDLDTIIACRLSSWSKKKKFIFDAHEIFTLVPELRYRPIRRWMWTRIANTFLRNSKYNYTVNHSLKSELEKKYNLDFLVIPNYPKYNERLKSRSKHEPVRLLYQGVLNKGRGLKPLILAISKLDNCVLYIAGSGIMYKELKSLVTKLKISDRVKLFGFLKPKRLKELTDICDIGVNLLDPKSKSYYYSSANKFFDYIASGLPSINMNFPEYQKINSKYNVALLVDSLDVNSIQQAIASLVENELQYSTLAHNCIEAHTDLNWKSQEKKLIEIYKKTIN